MGGEVRTTPAKPVFCAVNKVNFVNFPITDIQQISPQNVNPCPYVSLRLYQIFEPHLVQSSRNRQLHLSWKSKMVAAAILHYEKCKYIRIGWRRHCTKFGSQMHHGHMEMIAGTPIALSTTSMMAFIPHVFDHLSDEYNFSMTSFC